MRVRVSETASSQARGVRVFSPQPKMLAVFTVLPANFEVDFRGFLRQNFNFKVVFRLVSI